MVVQIGDSEYGPFGGYAEDRLERKPAESTGDELDCTPPRIGRRSGHF